MVHDNPVVWEATRLGLDMNERYIDYARRRNRRPNCSFQCADEESNPLGRWINEHDRGHFIRPLAELHRLYEKSPLSISESVPISLGFATPRTILSQPSARPHSK